MEPDCRGSERDKDDAEDLDELKAMFVIVFFPCFGARGAMPNGSR
jgi:hypothetical protein